MCPAYLTIPGPAGRLQNVRSALVGGREPGNAVALRGVATFWSTAIRDRPLLALADDIDLSRPMETEGDR
jgi:hypothetical protein